MLIVPAGCCLVAFAVLWAGLGGAAVRESSDSQIATRDNLGAAKASPYSRSQALAEGNQSLALDEVERSLAALSGEYIRPWRQRETSPRHLYSRASPRPIPTMSAEVEMTADEDVQAEGMAVATLVIKTGTRVETVPCVVDRFTRRVRIFAGGQWLTETQWLAQAPLPR
jgi:hypothetical protein